MLLRRIAFLLAGLLAFGLCSALALASTTRAQTPPATATPTPLPGMALDADGDGVTCQGSPVKPTSCSVPYSATLFTVLVRSSGIPTGGYGGFNSDLLFGGLAVTSRSCLDEIVWPGVFACQQVDSTPPPPQNKQHTARGGLFPPFQLSGYEGVLVEIQVACPDEGQFTVVLPAYDSANRQTGAAYVDAPGTPVPFATVGQQALDTDGDGNPDTAEEFDIADSLAIDCKAGLAPTSTPTATATPTPLPVGGVAFDAPSSGGAFAAWLFMAISSAALVALGGAAYARRRG